ncbi:cytochrome P450 [Colletotrichum abscissum]|uniref:cytochrome P450 n=1 Tax=Colletotrichum abscissum TaxID=1671311 RepID=UPI0027D4A65C|nr:cytochrome P450 [Colletotrichum abscissum]KAK1525188.1 cytochrome P450 [Colletotrichum abscissum]
MMDKICGKRIVKGVTLFVNSWVIDWDKKVFYDEFGNLGAFIPEIWLNLNGSLRTDLPLPVLSQGTRNYLVSKCLLITPLWYSIACQGPLREYRWRRPTMWP